MVCHRAFPHPDIAAKLNLNPRRVEGFLQYLANEAYVTKTDPASVFHITERARQIEKFWPWYYLLVGGYWQTLLKLRDTLGANGDYAERNSLSVAVGSCGISQYDALPITKRLLNNIPGSWRTIVDVGCGDGSYLIDLCRALPAAKGLGLEPNPAVVETARSAILRDGLTGRVEVRQGDAGSIVNLPKDAGPFCFLAAFVLQELLEQAGRQEIVNLLRKTSNAYPDAYWVVIEVDHQPTDTQRMSSGLGLGYYNPYYLLHHITRQRLENTSFWEMVFTEAGYRLVAKDYPEPLYDPLQLKVGFLLAPEAALQNADQAG